MTAFKPGDLVDIAIRGVRVSEELADGTVTVVAEHSDGKVAHWHMPPQAAVTHVAPPADWPPQPGDVWAADTMTFFVLVGDPDEPGEDLPVLDLTGDGVYYADLLRETGLRLAYRMHAAQDGGACKCGFRAPELGPHPGCPLHAQDGGDR